MTDSQEKLLNTWMARIKLVTQVHYESAALLEKRHFLLGVSSIMFTAILASKFVFATGLDNTETGKIVMGAIGLTSVCFSSFQLFFRLPERVEKFRVAGLSFASLLRQVENLAATRIQTESETQIAMDRLLEKWEELSKVSPTALPKVWARQFEADSDSNTSTAQ